MDRQSATLPADNVFRRALFFVLAANLSYFCVEFFVARRIGSVSLLADSIDFLEDASLSILILLALNRSPKTRARIGMLLAVLILVPGFAVLWEAWQKFMTPEP